MNKQEFLTALADRLRHIPEADRQALLDYYAELIEDMTEGGLTEGGLTEGGPTENGPTEGVLTEAEAVASLGSLDSIVEQIFLDMPLPKLVKARVKPKRRLRAWEIVLISAGSPIWVPILLALAVVALTMYLVLWTVAVSLYATDLCLGAGFLAGVAMSVVLFAAAQPPVALIWLGAGLACGGLAIFGFVGSNAATKGIWRLGKLILRGIKSCLIKKEEA